ncbi:hypothetical protein [Micromonospora sp. NPDC047738]|uniref:hypothetical protein n=1 Tax=unclassified Micromonospora TaxID=2617518 RepID=UPI0033EE3B6E
MSAPQHWWCQHHWPRGSYLGYHDAYRLFVTGSTPYLAGTDITGAHQRPVGVV